MGVAGELQVGLASSRDAIGPMRHQYPDRIRRVGKSGCDIRACPAVVLSSLVGHTGNDQLTATCDLQDPMFIVQHGYAQLCKNRQPPLDPEIIFVIAGYPEYAIFGPQITERGNVVLQFLRGTVDHIAGNSHQIG